MEELVGEDILKTKFHYDHPVMTVVEITAAPVDEVDIVETEVRVISEVVDEEDSVEDLIVGIEVAVVVVTSEVAREVVGVMEVLDIEVDLLEMVKDHQVDLQVICQQVSQQVLLVVDQDIQIILVQAPITFLPHLVLEVHLALSLQNKTFKNSSVEGMMMDDLIEGMTTDAVVTVTAIVKKITTGKREVTEMESDGVLAIIIENVMKETETVLIATPNDGDINKYRRWGIVCY